MILASELSDTTCASERSPAGPRSICVADRRSLWRSSVESALASSWEAVSVCSLHALLEKRGVDLNAVAAVLLLGGAGFSGNAALRDDFAAIEKSLPGVPVLIVTDDYNLQDVTEAMQNGAKGYLAASVSIELLIQCLRLLMIGGTAFPPVMATSSAGATLAEMPVPRSRSEANLAIDLFTPREIEVMAGLGEGKPNKIIAHELRICETTVKVHMRHIMHKLGATNRTQAALLAREMLSGTDQPADNHSGAGLNLAKSSLGKH